jgi:hypothetical protein
MTTASALHAEAATHIAKERESFDRCDTDGFVSQWAHGLMGSLRTAQAGIEEAGRMAEFVGLYLGDERIPAREIETQFGRSWLIRDDAQARLGRKFIPTGSRSRVQRSLGLSERAELAPAWAKHSSNGGACSVYVETYRTGCKWGTDATLVKE